MKLALMTYTLYVDGSLNDSSYSAGLVFSSLELEYLKIEYTLRLRFKASNNKIEYEVLLAKLRLARVVEATHLDIFSDSQLVVQQVSHEYKLGKKE